jgi:protein-disulfide isomerase
MSNTRKRDRQGRSSGGRPRDRRGRAGATRGTRRQGAPLALWGVVALLLIAAVVGFAVQSRRSGSSGQPVVTPAVVNGPDNGVLQGRASAAVLVDEYGDFTCPVCQRFQTTMGPTIARLVRQGTIRFNYHPIALLLQNGQDPARAANAALCAGEVSAADFWRLHDALFANQEPEGAGHWTAPFLVSFGHQQGISGSRYDQCVSSGTYLGFVDRITQQAQQRGINATPTIFIDGQLQQDPNIITSPAAFEAAVTHAAQTAQR